MKTIHLGAACLNQTPLDWKGNLQRIRTLIRMAKRKKVDMLCLPELSITGYGCEDMFLADHVAERAMAILQKVAREAEGIVVSVGLPVRLRNVIYNAVAVIAGGKVRGFVAKQHLAGDGLHYEPRWFRPWPKGAVSEVQVGKEMLPIGDLVFNIGGVRLGFEVCEDAWVAGRPGRELSKYGVDVIFNPSASHFAFRKQRVRERFVIEGSRSFGVGYVYSNLLGNESGRAIYDGGAMIASGGALVANGGRFSFEEQALTSAHIDLDKNRLHQAQTISRAIDPEGGHEVAIHWEFGEPEVPSGPVPPDPYEKEEAFARVMALGLFDYLRKSFSRGFIVSLSGGADSAAVASMTRVMIELVLEQIGEEGIQERLPWLDLKGSADEMMKTLLVCVYQSTRNSSDTTEDAAKSLAEALGATFYNWSVDELVEGYKGMVEGAIGRSLGWETDDITLQNIQARVRAPGAWMLANLRGSLLLATSNRSEAAVGYATMDGDTCGGLSPIAGIDKAFLRKWLIWLEKEGCPGIRPIPSLIKVNEQQPKAELRPQEAEQTDEGDLMPYELLDAIEKVAIRDKQSPADAYHKMRAQFPEVDKDQLKIWLVRFFQLWSRNQWKRERYAPSFHVDDENLDPKTWCRFPILSGGFSEELKELENI